ncbi:DUF881 domain-containing protein [Buchananella felis]|uniref:DUF881 domain-containing protein n=1 Tax=Buchananella felis TaxID=3231492 RepID=UPI0035285914
MDSERPRPKRVTRGSIAVFLAATLLGFGVVTQWRQQVENPLASMRQDDLVRYLDELTRRNEQLEAEELDLRAQLAELQRGADSEAAARAAAEQQAQVDGILAGTLPARGSGIIAWVTDPDAKLTAATVVNLLEELRNAGAEAISVNNVRITATSWVKRTGDTLVIDDVPVVSPLVITAIGEPQTLAVALAIPGGAQAQIKAAGASIRVEEHDSVNVEAVRQIEEPQYARVVPAS